MDFKLATSKQDRDVQLKMVDHVLEYVLETEIEDFDENPSKDHVYFKAYAAMYGMESANEVLADTLNSHDEAEGF